MGAIPYRFDPGHRHQVHIAEWSNPVARRAHNPKVVGSNPASATKKNKHPIGCLFLFDCECMCVHPTPFAVVRATRAHNLRTSENSSVNCFRDVRQPKAGRNGDTAVPCRHFDRATAKSGCRFKSCLRNQKRFHSRYNFGYGILLSIRKMPVFRPLTALSGGFEGFFLIKPINPPSSALTRQKWRILYV